MARTRFDASSRYNLDEGGMTASRIDQQSSLYTLYVVADGDTIENIAHRLLGDHSRWWEIADINPQLYGRTIPMLTFTPGDTIRVPS